MSTITVARNVRVAIWTILAVLVIGGAIWFAVFTASKPAPPAPSGPQGSAAAQVVREDSHRLTTPASEKAQLVEFLDFECESCRAAEPLVNELKQDYGDRITFIHRYFPLPGHLNSGTAAVAVEAAARQGHYEAMVTKLFETQPEWGGRQDSQAALFRTYAEGLGLDMAMFDRDAASEDAKERIRQDIADGKTLGVTGTPTFFLNGEKLTLNTEAQFRQLLDDAVQ